VEGSFENNFKVTPATAEAAIADKVDYVLVAKQPDRNGLQRSELRAIADVVEKKNEHVFVMADEIYGTSTSEEGHFSIWINRHIKDRVITVNGMAKVYDRLENWIYIGAEWIIRRNKTSSDK
jgi:aspartate aminotransferase